MLRFIKRLLTALHRRWVQATSVVTPEAVPLGNPFIAKVVWIHDGDSLIVRAGWREFKIRLFGVDAPERTQAFGDYARAFLETYVLGEWAEIRVKDRDHYGRTIARVIVKGLDVSEELLAEGLAWHLPAYTKALPEIQANYRKATQEARAHEDGLWSDPNPVHPGRWRAKNYR